MSRKILTNLDLAQNELQNATVQNLASAPSSPVKGQMYFNSTGGDNTLYWYDGTTWIAAKTGGSGFPGYGAVTAETAFSGTSADGVSTTVSRNDHKHGTPQHGTAAHNSLPLSTFAAATASINMGGFTITSVADGVNPTDVASVQQVNNAIAGMDPKASVKAATTANITLSGAQTVDGISLVALDRCLVKNQAAPAANGIYVVNASTWVRATDMDAWTEVPGAYCWVEQGTANGDSGWMCSSDTGGSIGTTAITWVQYYGGPAVPPTRAVNTTAPLTGGGALSGDLTLAISPFAGSAAGSVPVSVGGTANYLRADGTWAAPAGTLRKFTATNFAVAASPISHNFNTRDVTVEVYRSTTPWDTVDCDIERTDANTVTVRFSIPPPAGTYNIVIVG